MDILVEDIIGLFGVFLTLIAYFLLQIETIKSDSLSYSLLNTIGSILIFCSLLKTWNLSAGIMEISWLLISIYGFLKYYFRKRTIV
ncbi:MAG: hypothetical protein LEGION0398_MBIBDBAK_00559 [Legionellaceae bacterium]